MDFDPAELEALVSEKLATGLGSHWSRAVPVEERSFDEHLEQARRKVKTLPVWALAAERKPYGARYVELGPRTLVERSLRDGTFLELQRHADGWLSSQGWRAQLEALDDPERWVALGLLHESAGRIVDANAAFAAARWLEPRAGDGVVEHVLGERPAPLPDVVADQPTRGFASRKLGARHHAAWRMGKLGRANVPSLLAYESDPSFWVRARIYRSLGQVFDLAGIQVLHEGTLDPHPFARAQAVRSLGWLGDPTLVEPLAARAQADTDAEVRRSAALAVQRIVGFWRYFGEWNAIARSPERVVAVATELASAGLGACAYDVVARLGGAADGDETARESLVPGDPPGAAAAPPARAVDPRLEALLSELRPLALEHDPDNPRTRYHAWQGEAQGVEAAPAPEPSLDEARALAHEPGKTGWNARRVLRRHGAGTMAERRGHALE